jgi:predicted nucleic acid-binding protein
LVLALVGQADYLITGDKDLLELEEPFLCPILPLEQFLLDLKR